MKELQPIVEITDDMRADILQTEFFIPTAVNSLICKVSRNITNCGGEYLDPWEVSIYHVEKYENVLGMIEDPIEGERPAVNVIDVSSLDRRSLSHLILEAMGELTYGIMSRHFDDPLQYSFVEDIGNGKWLVTGDGGFKVINSDSEVTLQARSDYAEVLADVITGKLGNKTFYFHLLSLVNNNTSDELLVNMITKKDPNDELVDLLKLGFAFTEAIKDKVDFKLPIGNSVLEFKEGILYHIVDPVGGDPVRSQRRKLSTCTHSTPSSSMLLYLMYNRRALIEALYCNE